MIFDVAEDDPRIAALHRILTDAHADPQAKVDALVALAMRTVHVVPWPDGVQGYRTLVNSDGIAALPIFTTFGCLEDAAGRYGWTSADGSVPSVEIGARAALNHAVHEKLAYVVVDIASDHALEVSREEIEPLLTPAARRESTGPFALRGRVSSSLIRAVKSTPAPMRAVDGQLHPTPPPGTLRAPTPPPAIEPPKSTPGLTPPSGAPPTSATAEMRFSTPPSLDDEAYTIMAAALREYPEVEWAAMLSATDGDTGGLSVGVRIDASFRQRVQEVADAIALAASKKSIGVGVILLDLPEAARSAREVGEVFYPWRKK